MRTPSDRLTQSTEMFSNIGYELGSFKSGLYQKLDAYQNLLSPLRILPDHNLMKLKLYQSGTLDGLRYPAQTILSALREKSAIGTAVEDQLTSFARHRIFENVTAMYHCWRSVVSDNRQRPALNGAARQYLRDVAKRMRLGGKPVTMEDVINLSGLMVMSNSNGAISHKWAAHENKTLLDMVKGVMSVSVKKDESPSDRMVPVLRFMANAMLTFKDREKTSTRDPDAFVSPTNGVNYGQPAFSPSLRDDVKLGEDYRRFSISDVVIAAAFPRMLPGGLSLMVDPQYTGRMSPRAANYIDQLLC